MSPFLSRTSMELLKTLLQKFQRRTRLMNLLQRLPNKPIPMQLLFEPLHKSAPNQKRMFRQVQLPSHLQPQPHLPRMKRQMRRIPKRTRKSKGQPGWSIQIMIPVPKRRWPRWPDTLSLLNTEPSWRKKHPKRLEKLSTLGFLIRIFILSKTTTENYVLSFKSASLPVKSGQHLQLSSISTDGKADFIFFFFGTFD